MGKLIGIRQNTGEDIKSEMLEIWYKGVAFERGIGAFEHGGSATFQLGVCVGKRTARIGQERILIDHVRTAVIKKADLLLIIWIFFFSLQKCMILTKFVDL
jgi:hypothetical protein